MGIKDGKAVFDNPLRIRFRGEYDYDGLIALLRDFFRRSKMVIQEPKFKFKNGGTGAEAEFQFEGALKVSHYIAIFMQISGMGFDIQPKDVVVDGVKKRLTKGKMELNFQAFFQLDYAKMFEDGKSDSFRLKMNKKMHAFLTDPDHGPAFGDHKVWGKKNIEKLVMKYHKETKEFLGMECV